MSDIWNGQKLSDRKPLSKPLAEQIHYRLYDRRTRQLLSFNSTNSFASVVEDISRTQREHPTAQIIAVRYDGPA